ncbi:SMI1/KNR4 family protein [Clostridium thailandense]|uniref:SMI1/KNR4 family protein n=1 Tax=Clostridium thailandense TaxID=2794346 RepID=UPI0039891948
MSKIIEKIKKIPNLNCLKGCSTSQIKDAQQELGLMFPDEYIDYVKEYGVICFFGTEWTGLNVEGYLNTVEATKQEKNVNSAFPEGFFVLEDMGIDSKMAVVNEKGNVFILQRDKIELLCESLSEYVDMCIARKK